MRTKYTQTEELEIILETKGIEYEKEIVISELNNKRFDYYLPEYKMFIEFDGAQHHYPVEYFGGNEAYIKQVQTDGEKTTWCYQNGYNFLRLNHLMSLIMINELIDYSLNIESTNSNKTNINNNAEDIISEYKKELPYIKEWSELNINQKDLYIKELFDDYNKYLNDIVGYKIKNLELFEEYIRKYSKHIKYIGIIKYKNKYTKYYINESIKNDTDKIITPNNIINTFINELEEKSIFKYSHLPSKLIYEYYKEWIKLNNLNAKLMKSKEFNQKLNKYLNVLGYKNFKTKRINSIKRYEFNSKLLMSTNDLNEKNYNKSNYYNIAHSNSLSKILINEDLYFNDKDVEEVTDILINTKEFDQLKEYSLPVIQYCIENLCQTKPSLLTNLESIDKMYLYTKDELIEKLNMLQRDIKVKK